MGRDIDSFIWTEIFNCGKIGKIAIKSFLKHHPNLIVNVYGFEDDFEWIDNHKRIIKHTFPNDSKLTRSIFHRLNKINGLKGHLDLSMLKDGFSNGHLGTARLWAFLIQNRKEKNLIHFDSDTIFIDNLLDDIIEKGKQFDIVAPPRCYKYNPMGNNEFNDFEDTAATNCFLFNREKIDIFSYDKLVLMCQGSFNPVGHKVIDFFDPISFNIRKNNGKFYFLDFDHVGATNREGSRDNKYTSINNYNTPFKIDFGDKLIHFSAVGSGMNIFFQKSVNTAESYKKYALDRYALFCKIFYDEDLGIDLSKYEDLIEFFKLNVLKKI